uniref:VWFD domain-containing protein n=1 Tax=Eptatretus burgeri TaxID=7764 RepID=A0A8C4NBZ2_EPTBU
MYEATCSVWGQGHLRTFDQHSITFAGGCRYRFLYECREQHSYFSEFEVQYQRDSGSRLINEVILMTATHEITLRPGKVTMRDKATQENKVLSLPVIDHGLYFSKVGDYILIRHAQYHFTLSWNEEDNLMVTILHTIFFVLQADLHIPIFILFMQKTGSVGTEYHWSRLPAGVPYFDLMEDDDGAESTSHNTSVL